MIAEERALRHAYDATHRRQHACVEGLEVVNQSSEGTGGPLELLFDTIFGFQRTKVLKAALELDVFTSIADGADTAIALAQRSETSERGMRILCDYLAALGFLEKTSGRYALTRSSAFLNKKSRAYIGAAAEFLISREQIEPFEELTTAVRKGGVVAGEGVVAPDHAGWVKFGRAMAPLMARPAQLLADLIAADAEPSLRILDIAAGHGLYGISIARRNRNAEIVAVDWPDVLEIARENARAASLADRFRTIPGNAFEVDYGWGYDLVLLVNFLHHFDLETAGEICRKVYRALKDGGRVAIVEFIPDQDRTSPQIAVQFSMTMLATTPRGDAHTYSDYDRLLRNSGFSSSTVDELPRTLLRVVLARK